MPVGLLDEPENAPHFFSYSRVFNAQGTVFYRGADGQLTIGDSSSVVGTVGVVNVVQHVPVGQKVDAHKGEPSIVFINTILVGAT